MSASGYILQSTDQVPWSMPHLLSVITPSLRRSDIFPASSGDPSTGYFKSYSSFGKPYMSYIILGSLVSDVRVLAVYQCAETARMTLGLGSDLPSAFHLFVNSLSSTAFIGDPCPTKSTGSFIFYLISTN